MLSTNPAPIMQLPELCRTIYANFQIFHPCRKDTICLIAILVLTGCKEEKTEYSKFEKEVDNTNEEITITETLSYDNIVLPEGKTINGEIYVDNSEPVAPGAIVDIINTASSPAQVIVSDVTVLSARWKVSGLFKGPKYPASGFVRFALAENQWKAIEKNDDIIIQQSK